MWLRLIFGFVLFYSGLHEAAGAGVMSFKEWRSEQIQMALKEVVKLKSAIEIKKHIKNKEENKKNAPDSAALFGEVMSETSSAGADADKIQISSEPEEVIGKKLNQAQLKLERVRELTVNDYFILYLNENPEKDKAFREVVNKLSSEELTQLLQAYSQLLVQENQKQAQLQIDARWELSKEKTPKTSEKTSNINSL